jgi:hypothetical protein
MKPIGAQKFQNEEKKVTNRVRWSPEIPEQGKKGRQ